MQEERSAQGRLARRQVMLVVSSNAAFEQDVAALVELSGFRAEGLVSGESASLTFTRTQARVAIFDFDDMGEGVELVAAEAVTRSVPVLLLSRADAPGGRERPMAPGVFCAPFPRDEAAMSALLATRVPR